MSETTTTARVRWHAMLDELPVAPEQAAPLHAAFDRLDTRDGLRAIFAASLSSLLAHVGDAAVAAYREFRDRVPEPSRFGFMPLGDVSILHARVATLREPDAPIVESINRQTRAMVARGDSDSLMGQLIAVSDGRVERFLDDWMSPESSRLVGNFGERRLERVGRDSARIVYTSHHPLVAAHYVPGHYQGLLDWFDVTSEVGFETLGDEGFALELRWSR